MRAFRNATLLLLCCLPLVSFSQDQPDAGSGIPVLPSRFFDKVQARTAGLNEQITRQTAKYIQRLQEREKNLYKKLYRKDPVAAKSLFAGVQERYAALNQKLASDTGTEGTKPIGDYQANADSLQGMLKFLAQNQSVGQGAMGSTSLSKLNATGLQGSLSQLQTLQAKMQDADQIKDLVRQRKQMISDYVRQHTELAGVLGKDFQAMNQDLYYYSQQVREYKEMLNDPDKMTKQALALLNKMPAFQAFMKQNSQLAGLFNLPGNYGDPSALTGLQTRNQVAALIQQQVSAGGANGAAALQSNLQSAESQLNTYKDKLSKLGNGSGDIDMPDFTPNGQKTKPFWKRLQYGTNFQTTRNNYLFPTVSDFGLSVGYKITDGSTAGIGASYKLGWGNGIQHIALSSQGMGLRSFLDIKIKGSFSATGGLEYNYTTPFRSYQQLKQWNDWTKSGLIGVTKTVSVKSRFFKKTSIQLLWDFLSYQQVPKTQPLLFRVGYQWN
jgi:hypothetical protein